MQRYILVLFLFLSSLVLADDLSVVEIKKIDANRFQAVLNKPIKELSQKEKESLSWKVFFTDDRYHRSGNEYTPKKSEIVDDILTLNLEENTFKYADIELKIGEERWSHSKVFKIKRNVFIEGVISSYSPGNSLYDKGIGKMYYVDVALVFNIYTELRVEERKKLRWKIDEVYRPEYDGKEYFLYGLDKKHTFKAYFEGKENEAEEISAR